MLRRRQRGRRAPKQTIAYNQVFGHARREGSARSDRDRIENGVVKTGRYFKTQMRCRSSGTLEEAAHCSSALGAFEPAAGARRRSCGDSLSSEPFTSSFSVGGGNGCTEPAGLARGTGRTQRCRSNSPPHHRPRRDPCILKFLVLESFSGEEIDRARNNLSDMSVSTLLRKKQ